MIRQQIEGYFFYVQGKQSERDRQRRSAPDCRETPSLPSEGHPRVASLALRAIHLQVARRSRVGGVGAKSLECVGNNGHFSTSNLPPLSQLR